MRKVVLVGASMRATAFVNTLRNKFADSYKIVGIMDCDPGKMKGFKEVYGLEDVPAFTDFDEMCKTVAPDMVIVSTVYATHKEYIVNA